MIPAWTLQMCGQRYFYDYELIELLAYNTPLMATATDFSTDKDVTRIIYTTHHLDRPEMSAKQ